MEGVDTFYCKKLRLGNIYCITEEEWLNLEEAEREEYRILDVFDDFLNERLYEEDLRFLQPAYAQEEIEMEIENLIEEEGIDRETLKEEAREYGDVELFSKVQRWLESLPIIPLGISPIGRVRGYFDEVGRFGQIELKAGTFSVGTMDEGILYPAIYIKSIIFWFPGVGLGTKFWNFVVENSPYPLIVVEAVTSKEMWRFAVKRGCQYAQPNPEYRHGMGYISNNNLYCFKDRDLDWVIYTKEDCEECERAKAFLYEKWNRYKEIELDSKAVRKYEAQGFKFPIIYHDKRYIGTTRDLEKEMIFY